jgi:Methyltransferase domain
MTVLEAALHKYFALERLLINHLVKPSGYSFSQDWLIYRSPLWTQYLNELKGKEDIHLLEIGTYEGRSAIWFLENILTHPSSTITCIDLFSYRMAEIRFDNNIAVSGYSNRVTKIKGRSQDVLKLLREDSYNITTLMAVTAL